MGNVQPNYNKTQSIGFEGARADMRSFEVVSRLCQPASIAFGKAVIRGTADNQVTIGGAGSFVGLSYRDITLPAENADVYKTGDTVGVMTRGTMYAVPTANVADGDPVYYTAAGALTNASSGNTLIPNAVWETTAASGNIAVVRLN